ncbi:hypothetical protein ACIQGZ_09450 [Streptomyces sp. NPDC092296]|uniref:hypothetical protein n=1 Tax=Streptomyces sp. NPDC092296 TaxID=3366012 RepID=UPI0038061965
MAVAAGGLLLTGASPVSASSFDWPFGARGEVDHFGDSVNVDAGLSCRQGERVCANGPVDSGNLRNSQNVSVKGGANNTGNLNIVVGSLNSTGSYEGPQTNSNNSVQNVGRAPRAPKPARGRARR